MKQNVIKIKLGASTNGGTGDASFIIPVFQIGLGTQVSVDDILALPDNGIYTLGNATDDEKVGIGVVTKIVDDDNIEYQDTGTSPFPSGGLNKGYTYYLDVIDGGYTSTQPSDYIQPVFVAIETDEILINIEPMFVYGLFDFTKSIIAHYADCDALVADQIQQVSDAIYYVTNPTIGTITDSNITSGYVYYEYLGTTAGDMTDYKIIAAQQGIALPTPHPDPIIDISIAISDETSDLTDNGGVAVYTGLIRRNLNNISEVIVGLSTAGTGNALVFDVHINGVTMFSVLPSIDDGSISTLGASTPAILSITSASKGDKMEAFIVTPGGTIPGTGAKIYILAT